MHKALGSIPRSAKTKQKIIFLEKGQNKIARKEQKT
jgi:hypothetical protein